MSLKRFLPSVAVVALLAGLTTYFYWPYEDDYNHNVPLRILPDPGDTYTPTCNINMATPWTRHVIYDGLLGTDGVGIADFDGDTDMDVVSNWEADDKVTYSENPGPGAVRGAASWTTAQVGTLTSMEGSEIGDFDEDGNLDVCMTQQLPGAVAITFGPSAGWTTPANWNQTTLTAAGGLGIGWMDCAISDVDEDGHDDILIGGDDQGSPGQLSWIKAPAAAKRTGANWTPLTNLEASGRIMTLLVDDYDGDGDEDILTATRAAPNIATFWMEKTAPSTFTRRNISTSIPVHGNSHVYMLFEPGDLDDDGDLDICNGTEAGTTVLRCMTNVDSDGVAGGDWLSWVPTAIPYPAQFGPYTSSTIGFIDGDPYPDIVVASHNGAATTQSGLVWLKGPFWTRGEVEGIDAFMSKYDNLILVDFDGDGDLDILAGDQGDEDLVLEGNEGLVWYENPCLV